MLLDNKTQSEENEYFKVFDFIKNYTESGQLDMVTGFFSVSALSNMLDQINFAQKAVQFLQQEKVFVKTVQKNFCHAKAYIYQDTDKRKNYHIIGSSNLTDAGLGLKDSSNVELNAASTGDSNDWKETNVWFNHLWHQTAQEYIELPDKSKIPTKNFFIELISELFKEYSPKDLYYKVLYELFKDDLLSMSTDKDFNSEIKHLSETVIYQTLFPYQQKGVISLIKMLRDFNGAILADRKRLTGRCGS